MGFLFNCNHSQAADKAVVDTRFDNLINIKGRKPPTYDVLGGVIKQQTVESK